MKISNDEFIELMKAANPDIDHTQEVMLRGMFLGYCLAMSAHELSHKQYDFIINSYNKLKDLASKVP